MAQKLKFGNGTWATKQGSTLAYNDENSNFKPLPFTTTRASSATRVNKEGLIEVVGNDKPRIDYTDSADGALLLEPSRTNLVKSSGDTSIQSTYWSANQGGTSVQNATTAPDGSNTASQINTFGQQYGGITQGSISVSNNEYTYSIYLKAKNGTPRIRLILFDGVTFHSSDFTISSEWKRYDYKFTPVSGSFQIYITCPYVETSFYAWGAQLEAGSYPTSYIPTSGATATRLADTANGAGNSEVFNDSEGVLFTDLKFKGDGRISISNSDNSDQISFGNAGGIFYRIRENNANVITKFTGSSEDENHKFALRYNSQQTSIWIDGFELALSTVSYSLDNLSEFSFIAESSFFYGKTKELGYYDSADIDLEYLTSYRSLNELVTELNLNTL